MSESLSKTLMIIVTVVLVIIAAIALIGILNSSSDKSTEKTNKFNPNRLNIFIVSPPQGGHVKFYPVVDDNHKQIGYVSSFIMYTDKPLHNNTMYLKILNVPPDKIYVKPLGNETYNDGKITYHYKYNVTVFYDKGTFDRLYNDNKNNYVYVSIGSGTISSLNYGEIEIDNTSITFNKMTENTTELKYPTIIVGINLNNNGNINIDKIIIVNNSESKPTTYVVYEPSVPEDLMMNLSNMSIIIGSNIFNNGSEYLYNTYEFTGNNIVTITNNITNVTITKQNGTTIISKSNVPVIQYPGYDTNKDNIIDTILLLPDFSNVSLYIDSGLELHYSIMNFDVKYMTNIQTTGTQNNNTTNNRWITLTIIDYSGDNKTDAIQKYNNNEPTKIITQTELEGRYTTEETKYTTPIKDNNNNIIGYNINPQGYIKERVDLVPWLRDTKYHILKIKLYVNGHLWNKNTNQPSNKIYQITYEKTLEVDNTGGLTLYNSTISSKLGIKYIMFFVSNPLNITFTIWNKTTNTTDIVTTLYLREGNNTRGTDEPITTLINNYLGQPYPENDSYDESIYINKKDDYENITKQNNITIETLNGENNLVIKIISNLVEYGIYDIDIKGKDVLTFVNKYFLWDGTDIWWLDFDKNIGHYYPNFPYKKPYNITNYHGDTLFGQPVLTYIVFTNDTFENPHYIENVPINESIIEVDLNNDGDIVDTINKTVYDNTLYKSLMNTVNGQPVWQTKYVGIRFTYIEDGIGETEIPFYIENIEKGQNPININGKNETIWVAKIWVKIPIIRDSSTGDLNNGYLYWYGKPYDIDGTLNNNTQ